MTNTSGNSNTAQIELERTPPPCDRCGNPSLTITAKHVVVYDERGIYSRRLLHLSWCGHHFGFFEALLMLAGWTLVADTRGRLATREATRRAGDVR